MMLAHFRETPLVRLAPLPFLQQWIDDHREIETDQKSPHGVSFWRTVACGNGPTILGGEGERAYGSTNQQGRIRFIWASHADAALLSRQPEFHEPGFRDLFLKT
jgi:hypothetical protein